MTYKFKWNKDTQVRVLNHAVTERWPHAEFVKETVEYYEHVAKHGTDPDGEVITVPKGVDPPGPPSDTPKGKDYARFTADYWYRVIAHYYIEAYGEGTKEKAGWDTAGTKSNHDRFNQMLEALQDAGVEWENSASWAQYLANITWEIETDASVRGAAQAVFMPRKWSSTTPPAKDYAKEFLKKLKNTASDNIKYRAIVEVKTADGWNPAIQPIWSDEKAVKVADVPLASEPAPAPEEVEQQVPPVSAPSPTIPPGVATDPVVVPDHLHLDDDLQERISANFHHLSRFYKFSRELDEIVWLSTWFIRNGSCILKGVAGTGKTTLIECSTFLFANSYDYSKKTHLHPEPISFKDVKRHLTVEEVLGEAKHNLDKKPDDVFFETEVRIEKRRIGSQGAKPIYKPGDVEGSLEAWGDQKGAVWIPEALIRNAKKRNPLPRDAEASVSEEQMGFMEEMRFLGYPPLADDIDYVEIRPRAREVVNAMIKFHNEANRMNPDVADAFLGILAEGQVEYLGKPFWSPRKGGNLDLQPRSQLNFLDYNPHLDLVGQELDRALLDRITTGIYISAGNVGLRLGIMEATIKKMVDPGEREQLELRLATEMGAEALGTTEMEKVVRAYLTPTNQRQLVNNYIQMGWVTPIQPMELMKIWNVVDSMPVDTETLAWIAYFTSLPNLSVMLYKEWFADVDWTQNDVRVAADSVTRREGFIDTSLMSYEGAYNFMQQMKAKMRKNGLDMFEMINALRRPLGIRSANALLELYRATTLLHHIRAKNTRRVEHTIITDVPSYSDLDLTINVDRLPGQSDDDYTKAVRNRREQVVMDLLKLLPYVLDHRVNIGVEQTMQNSFLNFFQFVENYFVPHVVLPELTGASMTWFTLMEISMRINKALKPRMVVIPGKKPERRDPVLKPEQAFDAFVREYANAHPDAKSEAEAKKEIMTDPFKYAFATLHSQ